MSGHSIHAAKIGKTMTGPFYLPPLLFEEVFGIIGIRFNTNVKACEAWEIL
jgi:hypothetical protein